MPSATMNGQAVGAGTRIEFDWVSFIVLTSDHVDHGEDRHPNRIHEVPIPGKQLESPALSEHASAQSDSESKQQQRQSNRYVTRVQADQRVEGGAEQVCADRQMEIANQVAPLHRGVAQEFEAEQD